MSGITNPAEEYFKDGLWGWVATAWKKLVATAGGALHIQFAGQEVDVEVKQTAAADLTPGVCGWDGSAWHKLPMLWGYSDRYARRINHNNVPAGNVTADFGPVDAGEVWVLRDFSMLAYQDNYSLVTVYLSAGGTLLPLAVRANPGAGLIAEFHGNITMKKDDFISIIYNDAVLNDDFITCATGYKMLNAE